MTKCPNEIQDRTVLFIIPNEEPLALKMLLFPPQLCQRIMRRLLTFIIFVEDVQTVLSIDILGLGNFELTYWWRQELNLLQSMTCSKIIAHIQPQLSKIINNVALIVYSENGLGIKITKSFGDISKHFLLLSKLVKPWGPDNANIVTATC